MFITGIRFNGLPESFIVCCTFDIEILRSLLLTTFSLRFKLAPGYMVSFFAKTIFQAIATGFELVTT